jgi:SOS-response transcriptional repressor LexA
MPKQYDTSPYESWTGRIVEAVAEYWDTFGYGPSIRDVCNATGMATHSRMQRYVDRMRAEGLLHKADDVPRSLRVPDTRGRIVICPNCGERLAV